LNEVLNAGGHAGDEQVAASIQPELLDEGSVRGWIHHNWQGVNHHYTITLYAKDE
jgi:hypothetical protein